MPRATHDACHAAGASGCDPIWRPVLGFGTARGHVRVYDAGVVVDLLTLFIPVFILGIAVEAVVGRVTKRKIFRGPDVLADLSLGTMQTLFGIVGGVLIVGAYIWLYDHWRVTTIEKTTLTLVVMLVLQDFFYYWFHRCSHRVNVLWATHAP